MDPEFDWRDHIAVTGDDNFKIEVEQCLDLLAKTPEGQDLISYAALENQERGFSVIELTAGLEESFDENFVALAHPEDGTIEINRDAIRDAQYYMKDGGEQDISLNRVLFHELSHMRYPDYTEDEIIETTNAYMTKYFDSPEREYHEGPDTNGTPELEIYKAADMVVKPGF